MDYRIKIALFEPRIPQNTGNIARTCAAFNLSLDLIEPLGFTISDKYLKRAGLDYWKLVKVQTYISFTEYLRSKLNRRIIAFSKKGITDIGDITFKNCDILLFGREDTGLPLEVLNKADFVVRIPMPGGITETKNEGVRSLNLSVACGIAAYKAIHDIDDAN